MTEVTVGIDIGGTNSRVGLVDREGNVLKSERISTSRYKSVEEYIKALDQLINNITGSGNYDLKGIGVGAPNANYHRGTIENAPNLPWKGIIPFKEIFGKYKNLPFALTNDANAAAIGEKMFGVAKNFENFVVLTLGTGLGSGIIINGEVLYGHSGLQVKWGILLWFQEDGNVVAEAGAAWKLMCLLQVSVAQQQSYWLKKMRIVH